MNNKTINKMNNKTIFVHFIYQFLFSIIFYLLTSFNFSFDICKIFLILLFFFMALAFVQISIIP